MLCTSVQTLKDQGLKIRDVAITEVSGPQSFIPKHRSEMQGRYRLICPLTLANGSRSELRFPGFGVKYYEAGRCFWFDESYEHEMLHQGEKRAALFLDVRYPGL